MPLQCSCLSQAGHASYSLLAASVRQPCGLSTPVCFAHTTAESVDHFKVTRTAKDPRKSDPTFARVGRRHRNQNLAGRITKNDDHTSNQTSSRAPSKGAPPLPTTKLKQGGKDRTFRGRVRRCQHRRCRSCLRRGLRCGRLLLARTGRTGQGRLPIPYRVCGRRCCF